MFEDVFDGLGCLGHGQHFKHDGNLTLGCMSVINTVLKYIEKRKHNVQVTWGFSEGEGRDETRTTF